MPLLDSRGYLFGKINLIDAAVAAVVLLLVPLGYGAYWLFRTPVPEILSVEPGSLTAERLTRVVVKGHRFRPFLFARAELGRVLHNEPKRDPRLGSYLVRFLVENPENAEAWVPALPPGTYDFVLYDEARELARKPAALTVRQPEGLVTVVGMLRALTADDVEAIRSEKWLRVGEQAEWGRPIALGPPETGEDNRFWIGAQFQLRCVQLADGCAAGGEIIAPGKVIPLAVAIDRNLELWVTKVNPTDPRPVMVSVRFVVRPEVLALAHRDVQVQQSKTASPHELPRATLIRLRDVADVIAQTRIDPSLGTTQERLKVLTADLSVPAQKVGDIWKYEQVSLKVGESFTHEMPEYVMRGVIVAVDFPRSPVQPSDVAPAIADPQPRRSPDGAEAGTKRP